MNTETQEHQSAYTLELFSTKEEIHDTIEESNKGLLDQ